MHERVLEQFRSIVGENGVLVGDQISELLTEPRNVYRGSALAAVRPSSTDEVSEVLQVCLREDVAVVPQGGNSGLSGGATPVVSDRECIVLSLTRMNRIESIDADRWTMTVQAGVTVEALQEAAAENNRLFAPDWGARGTATIGGAIACDAGGMNVLRYGNTREQILGLEVVFPDGRIWDGLRALRKDSSGYDIKQLFVGSEGTLGVVTRAVVRLWPATPHSVTSLAAVSDISRLPELFAMAMSSVSASLTAFELIPNVGMDRVCEVFEVKRPIEAQSEFYALIKLDSGTPVLDLMTDFLESAERSHLICDAVVASTPQQTAQLWMMRDELPPHSIYRDTQHEGLKMDTAVPLDRIADYHRVVNSIAEELVPDALCYGFGHVGDGNIHMMILPTSLDQVAAFGEKKPELKKRIDAATVAVGGTLSAEHGVGQELRRSRASSEA